MANDYFLNFYYNYFQKMKNLMLKIIGTDFFLNAKFFDKFICNTICNSNKK